MCETATEIFNKHYNIYSNWSYDQIFTDGLKNDNINNTSFLFKLAMLNDVRKGSSLFNSVKILKVFIYLYLVVIKKMSVDRS